MKTRRVIAIAIGAATLAAWYLFRPERVWIDSTASESLEDVARTGASTTAATTGVVLLRGAFHGVNTTAPEAPP
jgi:hypothetical protein